METSAFLIFPSPVRQRYTYFSRTASCGLYRFEELEMGTTFDLLVNEKALVVDYPGIWKWAEMNPPGDDIPSPPRETGSSSVRIGSKTK